MYFSLFSSVTSAALNTIQISYGISYFRHRDSSDIFTYDIARQSVVDKMVREISLEVREKSGKSQGILFSHFCGNPELPTDKVHHHTYRRVAPPYLQTSCTTIPTNKLHHNTYRQGAPPCQLLDGYSWIFFCYTIWWYWFTIYIPIEQCAKDCLFFGTLIWCCSKNGACLYWVEWYYMCRTSCIQQLIFRPKYILLLPSFGV